MRRWVGDQDSWVMRNRRIALGLALAVTFGLLGGFASSSAARVASAAQKAWVDPNKKHWAWQPLQQTGYDFPL